MSTEVQNAVVWVEIPVTDLGKAAEFYGIATGRPLTMSQMGPDDVAVFAYGPNSVGGHLFEGAPAAQGGAITHLPCVGQLEEIMERTQKAGGKILSPIVDIPFGRFAHVQDLDGNTIGLFEAG